MKISTAPDCQANENVNAAAVSLEGLNALVAEDNDLNWEIVSQLLSLCKITSQRAVDGRDCLDRLSKSEKNTFDIVLMDVQMPNMNGKQATVHIRKSDREDIRTIPVVALTADAFDDEIASCKASGMDGYISKPVDLNKLKAQLQKVLFEQKDCSSNKDCLSKGSEPSTQEEAEIFSYEKLYSIFSSDEIVVNVLQAFLTSHRDDIDSLKKCFDIGDYQQSRPIIHSLIGVSGNFCLYRLYNVLKKLQRQVHAGKVECFDELTDVWTQTIQEIEDTCKSLSNRSSDNNESKFKGGEICTEYY